MSGDSNSHPEPLEDAVAKWERREAEQEAARIAAERRLMDDQRARREEWQRNVSTYTAKLGTVVAPVVVEIRQKLSGKILVIQDQNISEHGTINQIYRLHSLIESATVQQTPWWCSWKTMARSRFAPTPGWVL